MAAKEQPQVNYVGECFHAANPCFVDRYATDKDGVDVLLQTLDAEAFLERFLFSLYAEVPVARLIVCDGGSKDRTISILEKFPRVELHIRPDIRTTGKGLEFLLSQATAEWVMHMDADLSFPRGWYDEMCKYRDRFDAFDSARVLAYEFYREDPAVSDPNKRPVVSSPQMARRKALEKYKVDDDYIWRIDDIVSRQAVEKAGFRYGKVSTTFHFHHTTEVLQYESDPSKSYHKIVFEKPKFIVVNPKTMRDTLVRTAKAYVKYVDPNLPYVPNVDDLLALLEREWIQNNGPAWLERYDRARRSRGFSHKLRVRLRNAKKSVAKFLYDQINAV
jgi:glycosyltransferase involved in cell wall biosynthesis